MEERDRERERESEREREIERKKEREIYTLVFRNILARQYSAEQNVETEPEKGHIPSQSAQTTVCSVLSIMQIAYNIHEPFQV